MNKIFKSLLPLLLVSGSLVTASAETTDGNTATNSVPFDEVRRLIREHLTGTSDQELNDAAVRGLIEELKPHVMLGHSPASFASTNAPVTKVERFRKDFGYLRVDAIRNGLRKALREAIDKLLEKGPLNGLVVDLRFTGGTDYEAAAKAAGLFTDTDMPLLRVGDKAFSSGTNETPVLIPVMTLINGSTSGAGEAMAAALRFIKAGLIIGGKTSGEAMLFEEFPLSNGQVIRIASKPIELGDGQQLPRAGLVADIAIVTTPDEDRHYLDDPYWTTEARAGALEDMASHHRLTEADLVRQRREGISLQQLMTDSEEVPAKVPHLVTDPVLGRALDMLKALTVVQTWKHDK